MMVGGIDRPRKELFRAVYHHDNMVFQWTRGEQHYILLQTLELNAGRYSWIVGRDLAFGPQ